MKEFVAIDFETATHSRNSACALGLVKVINDVIMERHYWLFQPPQNRYEYSTIAVHGITPDLTSNLATIEGIYSQLLHCLEGKTVAAHNASFDISVLEESLKYYGLVPPKPAEVICTCLLNDSKKLEECCEIYGIELEHHHDALCDAEVCAKILLASSGRRIVKPRKTSTISVWAERKISSDILAAPDLSQIENKDHIFYDTKIVITGVFDRYPDRNELAALLKSFGADIQTSISRKTNYVICGNEAGPSKLKKIREINENGSGRIEIIGEKQLIALLTGNLISNEDICLF